MIVLTLTNCPISLRGDITKWLIEINTGVFVGRVSARVRDNLWKRVIENVKQGQATLVYNTNNEQHMEFRIHQSQNEIIDFDGLKLVLKPSPARVKRLSNVRLGFSRASKMRMATKQQGNVFKTNYNSNSSQAVLYPSDYVILDIETTGLDYMQDEIIEIGILKVKNNIICNSFSSLIRVNFKLKPIIVQLTGLSDPLLQDKGNALEVIMPEVKNFIGSNPIIGHNIGFDIKFMQKSLEKCGLYRLTNRTFDTMEMYTKVLNGKKAGRRLLDVAKHYNITTEITHRSLADCNVVKSVYDFMKTELKSK